MSEPRLRVEVAYALPDRQSLIALDIDAGCSALDAVRQSGITQQFPDLDIENATLGVWGRILKDPASIKLRDGDRVEIYRPLLIDPKVVRQARADARAVRTKTSRKRIN
jgi:putative ubiquitin-RnfH superfamily antitoxin RatB of RatAB toxin-antitoxin module